MSKEILTKSEHYTERERWLDAIQEGRVPWDSHRTLHFSATRVHEGFAFEVQNGDKWKYIDTPPEFNESKTQLTFTGPCFVWNKRPRVYFCASDSEVTAAQERFKQKQERQKRECVVMQ